MFCYCYIYILYYILMHFNHGLLYQKKSFQPFLGQYFKHPTYHIHKNVVFCFQPIKLPFVRDMKFLKEKEWGPLIPADIDRMGLNDQCKLICRILTEHLSGIMEPQVIPGNRCPLVRFKYQDIKCDLSLNNK